MKSLCVGLPLLFPIAAEMKRISGGTFRMGTADGFAYEQPVHSVNLKSFWMDSHAVTNGKPVANWRQGIFPERNPGEDGYRGRAPVGKFSPNGYGLYDMAGTVRQWCVDWLSDKRTRARRRTRDARGLLDVQRE